MVDFKDYEDIKLIGCTHFYHYNIINFCNRISPLTNERFKDAGSMTEHMIFVHNSVVSDKDLYINLGDFSFGNSSNWKKVMGHLKYKDAWLIQGNHDREHQQDILGSGFSNLYRKFWLIYHGYNILLTHKPCITDDMLKRIEKENPNLEYDIRKSYTTISPTEYEKMNLNIHAHIHNSKREQLESTGKHFNVSADVLNFTPISINTILEKMFNVKVG